MKDFEEYTRLYAESWSDPQVRWLLSTVPSSMIFDDHEMIDDWNTSAAWRREITGQQWWKDRISGGLVSYWIYQHLGNLSPQELAENTTWQAIKGLHDDSDDAEPILREMAEKADTEPGEHPVELRAALGRRAADHDRQPRRPGARGAGRRMVDDEEFAWIEAAMQRSAAEGVQHLIIGTSLPWLLPHAIHNLERWNETLNVRHEGRWRGRLAEKLRQAADLEHWAAFGDSFERLGRALASVPAASTGPRPRRRWCCPATSTTRMPPSWSPGGLTARVHQLTVSPLHNQAPHPIRVGFRIGWSRWAQRFTRGLARLARAEPSAWSGTSKPARSSATRSASWCCRAARRGSSCR